MASQPRLKDLAYYGTGGVCEKLYLPTSVAELSAALKEIHAQRWPYFLLGGGTNSLVLDDPWPGAVIAFHQLNRASIDGNLLTAEAGAVNTDLAEMAATFELTGIAWMNRLPGQIGATVRMNARCYGGEISEVVERVVAVTPDGSLREYTDKSMFRGYKDTVFMTNGEVIAAVDIRLAPGTLKDIRAVMDHCRTDREGKGQFVHPTCGCVFKNNYTVGVPSGMLLEAAGVKAMSTDRVAINPHHANFVYNKGASSREILEMTLAMREAVFQKFGAWLEYEMEILGKLPADLAARVQEKRPHQLNDAALAPLRARFTSRNP